MKPWDAPMGVSSGGRRRWLRWLVLAIFVVALSVAFVNLGFWQLARLDQRRAANTTVVAHENSAPVSFESVFNRQITDADQWQRVQVRGTFDAETQFLVRYRSNAGRTGYEVVTPLRTTTGQAVLVDRGFAIKANNVDYPTLLPPPPTGEVDLIGYVRRDEQGPAEGMSPLPPANSIRLINSEVLAKSLPYPIVNGYLTQLEINPPQESELAPVQPPELTEGNHFSYALQWFTFALMAGVGLILMIRSDLKAEAKQAAGLKPQMAAGADVGPDRPAETEAPTAPRPDRPAESGETDPAGDSDPRSTSGARRVERHTDASATIEP